MRASRLVSILLLLQVHGSLPAAELARRLEVSVRTIYRDLDALSEAGVPVFARPGAGGGCGLLEGYRTRLDGLNAEEARALFLAGVPGPAGELGLGTALADAQLKLLAALPAELRAGAGRARERFHLDAPRWFEPDGDAGHDHLATIAGAVWEDRLLRLAYRREGAPLATRAVEPLGLVLKAGVWYLIARLPGRGDPHVYRVSRVETAAALEERFERPAGFDLAGFWSRWTSAFESSLPRVEVTARLAPDVVEAARGQAIDVRTGARGPDGWLTAVLTFERIEWAVGAFLALGADAEVVEPAELRAQVAEAALATARRYSLTAQPAVTPLLASPDHNVEVGTMALNDQVKFTWVGHGTWKVRTANGKDMLIDPWMTGNPSVPEHLRSQDRVDIMVLTHGHADHATDAIPVANATNCKVLAPYEVGHWLMRQGVSSDNVIAFAKGGTVELDGITFTMVHAEHFSSMLDWSYGGEPVGYVITFENGFKVYFSGDTDVFGDMALIRELEEPEVAFLSIGDFYTMGVRRAAKAIQLLGVKTVVPMHYGTFPALHGTPAQLQELAGPGVTVVDIKPGDEI
jgi:predicted DNA-binding transcriptional regulator YafY/L-ascorbate metabolism protein UlaG (beta-lactamase superfamily)